MKKKYVSVPWKYVMPLLILLSGVALWYTENLRVKAGYFNDGNLITWNAVAYAVFFGLFSGYIISSLINKATGGKNK
jgi:hypothetical protein